MTEWNPLRSHDARFQPWPVAHFTAGISQGACRGHVRRLRPFAGARGIRGSFVAQITNPSIFLPAEGATLGPSVGVRSMAIYAIDGSARRLRLVDGEDLGDPDELHVRDSWDSRSDDSDCGEIRTSLLPGRCGCALCCRPWDIPL